MKLSTAAIIASLVAAAQAHTTVYGVWVNGSFKLVDQHFLRTS